MDREIVGGRTSFCFAARKLEALGGTTTTVKLTVGQTPLVSKPKILYIIPNAGLTKVHPTVNDLFAGKIIPAVPYAGRIMCFLNSSKMLTRDQGIFSTKEGYKITSPTKSHHKKNATKYPHESSTGKSGGYGNFGDADKGSYNSVSERSEESFSNQFIPSWETRWELSPSNHSEGTKQTYSLPTF